MYVVRGADKHPFALTRLQYVHVDYFRADWLWSDLGVRGRAPEIDVDARSSAKASTASLTFVFIATTSTSESA